MTLPTFFLALPGGVLIEHVDKRKAIIFLQTIMMLDTFALAILALSGFIQIWHIVITSLILGIATAFEITARQAMLIELVGRESLPNAIALQSTAFNMSRVLGPALAAPALLLFSTNGEGWIFLLNGISFVAIITSLFLCEPVTSHQCCHAPAQCWLNYRKAPSIFSRIRLWGCWSSLRPYWEFSLSLLFNNSQ
ncbi:MFS transporter [Candidatus Villigracilis affinis]|uniref:MFS transporter n=1 Tax=Candidatus Villigracilis affinis TaxID=3140682 RepID=UPI002A1CA5DA|nr:MFS transporter [Anaerolineales bacterium]